MGKQIVNHNLQNKLLPFFVEFMSLNSFLDTIEISDSFLGL